MKPFVLFSCAFLVACSTDANHLGNPLLLPINGIGNALSNASYAQRRGAVELFVKTNHNALVNNIENGGGPALQQAMETAQIPQKDRSARTTQLQGDLDLYSTNIEALIVALMVYGA